MPRRVNESLNRRTIALTPTGRCDRFPLFFRMVQTRVTLPPAEILKGTPSVAFRSRRNATEGVPYSVTPTVSKLNHVCFFAINGQRRDGALIL